MRKETSKTKIPEKVKKAVWTRDGGRCIVCLRPGNPWCHYIPRSQGGLGIEQNIVTLCPVCHREFDEGPHRNEIYKRITDYLEGFYPGWSRESVIYKKGDI